MKNWTYAQIALLWEMALNRAPGLEISIRLGKPYEDVCAKARELGISLAFEQPASSRTPFRHLINEHKAFIPGGRPTTSGLKS